MMAGAILLFLAFTGLGEAVKFIPRPVVLGFTNGIALLIASTQIKDFLGLNIPETPSEFFSRMAVLGVSLDTVNWTAVALGTISLALILFVPRVLPRVPGSIVALVAGTAFVAVIAPDIDTIGSRFGGIPAGLPSIQVPAFRADLILPLLPAALTVAFLAAVESLLSAVVADTMSGDRHNANAELMAQGVANLVVPVVGGIPVTGAIARTATNFRSSSRSARTTSCRTCRPRSSARQKSTRRMSSANRRIGDQEEFLASFNPTAASSRMNGSKYIATGCFIAATNHQASANPTVS
jgi:SulP family sulfate permease